MTVRPDRVTIGGSGALRDGPSVAAVPAGGLIAPLRARGWAQAGSSWSSLNSTGCFAEKRTCLDVRASSCRRPS